MTTSLRKHEPEMLVKNGKCIVSSLDVAEKFGKNHFDLLKAIKNLDSPKEFNERNFTFVEYKDAKGELRPMVEMTRDGFCYFVMGFTGRKAAEWKVAYINSFNCMEQKLLEEYKGTLLLQGKKTGARACLELQGTLQRTGKKLTFVHRIKKYRKVNKLKKTEVAKLLGVTAETIRSYERRMIQAGMM